MCTRFIQTLHIHIYQPMVDTSCHSLALRIGGKYRLGKKMALVLLVKNRAKHPQLEYEPKVYKTPTGGMGVPFIRW
ncbi:uncharacterized protein LACBIDRAFT_305216 [Laccaria bicolor S238N-H82]|uniref:Predicted protein n=1 Tax=Laccaria bicolor (strain S238N-H82 / ATCC MYA-4686) TaxID=486041 RepID=B0CTP9_LACBS|nr:uncharacterized protein LACBIDRAFT_305216 [Laccaria bicolor S238N-H82]EDR14533.1 predicted protein [Laccaria bicolor S238N-H82]|eukprot:XP_001875092.1 predicted protein [Laccaria bicolor S238N-H82]